MAKQNNDHNRIKELWNSSLDEVNNTINVSSTSVVAGSLKKHIDHVRAETDLTWYPEEGYEELKEQIKLADFNEAKRKAEEQGFFGEAAGFIAQGASEIVLGTLEGVGYLVDDVFGTISGGEKDYSNWFSDAMSNSQDWVRENAPIYQDPLNEQRSTWQNMIHGDGWWAQNGVSLVSAVSLMIPVAGAARSLGFIGKAGKVLGTAGKAGKLGKVGKIITTPINLIDDAGRAMGIETKIGKQISSGITKSVISRHLENNIEAADVFKQKYDEYINMGMSEEDARKNAGTAASFTYNAGWANIWQDALQYTLLAKGFNISKGVTTAKLAKGAGTSVAKALTYNMGRKGLEFITEGMEEAYQFIIAEEGKHLADVQAGLIKPDESTLSDRLKKYSEDSELWTSAFFGGLGGNVFSTALPAISKLTDKLGANSENKLDENQARLNEILTWKERESQAIRDYFESQQIDDEKGFEMAKTKMSFNTGVRAAMEGNWAIRKGQLEDLKKATPEEISQTLNIPIEAVDDYVSNLDNHINTSEEAAKLYAANVNKYGESTAYQVSYLQYMTNHYNNKIPELGKVIEDEIQKVPGVNNLTPQGKLIFNSKLTTLAAKRVIDYNNNIVNKRKGLSEEDRNYYNKRNEYLNTIIENNDKSILEAKDLGMLSPNDRIALSYLTGGVTDELVKASIEKELAEMYVDKWLEDIDNLTSKSSQEKIKAKQEEINKSQQDKVRKEANKKNSEKANQKANKIPDYKYENDLEEAELGSQEEESKPVDFKDLHKLIENGQVDISQLDSSVKEAYNNWVATNLNISEDVRANENNVSSNLSNIETQVSENIEDYTKGSDNLSTVTQISTPLAYLSVNNSRAEDKDKTIENIALSNFLESGEPVNDIDIVFEIDLDLLNVERPKGWKTKPVDTILTSLNNNKQLTADQLEVLPVKGLFYKNGEPFIYNDVHLRMYIHDADFFKRIPNTSAEFQIEKSLQHKQLILDAYYNNNKLQSSLVSKTNGIINNDTSENAFNKNILSDVIKKSYENMEFLYGDNKETYLTPDKKISEDFSTLFSATKGSVYIKVETANGKAFPLRLKSSKISEPEAELIYSLYITIMKDFSYLNKPVNTKLENGVSLGDTIRESEQAIIKGLDNYLDFNKITYNQLLNHLIFEGKTTANKKEARLMLMSSEEVEGRKIPPTIVFGENRLALKELLLEDNKTLFIENLTSFRNRQVDINYLGNNLYKEYIDVNKIVTTNVIPSDIGAIFIQPVVEYNDNLTPFEKKTETAEKETLVSKGEVDEVLEEGTDLSALIMKALDKNRANPPFPKLQDTNSFLDSINNIAEEASEDGEAPLFSKINTSKWFESKPFVTSSPLDLVQKIINDPNTKLLDLDSLIEDLVSKNKIRGRNTITSKFEKNIVNFLNKLGITGFPNEYNMSDKQLENYYLSIIDKIKPLIKDTKIYSYKDSRISLLTGATKQAGFANYANEVYLGDIAGLNLRNLVHELMHSVTQHALHEGSSLYDSEFHNNIKGFLKTAREQIKDRYYGLSNEHELIAEAFSNLEFQMALSKVKTNSNGKSSNMFLSIINEISKLFRRIFRLDIKSTLLEDIFNTVGNKLENTTDISTDQVGFNAINPSLINSKENLKYISNKEIIDFAKGKAVNYEINSANTEILVPYSKFDKSIAYNIAKRMMDKINKKYPGAASLNTSYSTGTAVNIHPKQPKVDQIIEDSFERDLGYYRGDIALMEQEEGFNFSEYEITPEEWLSLSEEEKSKIIKCK